MKKKENYNKEEYIQKAKKDVSNLSEEIKNISAEYKKDFNKYLEFLDFASKFHQYSPRNQMLIQ